MKPKKSPGPKLIKALTELRDVLRRGEAVGARFKITRRERPPESMRPLDLKRG